MTRSEQPAEPASRHGPRGHDLPVRVGNGAFCGGWQLYESEARLLFLRVR